METRAGFSTAQPSPSREVGVPRWHAACLCARGIPRRVNSELVGEEGFEPPTNCV